jgi:predicted ATPase
MFLKSASFKHFKSLDSVDIEFSTPITVLVGPNAVGKSNVVDGLRFVRDAVAVDLEHAVSKRGGIGRVRQYSPTRPYKIGVELRFKQSFANEKEREARYEFSILSKTQSNYLVDAEALVWFDSMFDSARNQDEPAERTFARNKTGDVQHSEYGGRAYRVPVDQLALGTLFAGARDMGWPVERFVRAWRFSSLYPNLLREPSSPDKDTVLTEDGKNWASVIKALKRTARGRAALERVFEAMRAVIPSFEDVSVSTVGSYLVPRFRFRKIGRASCRERVS